jgi:uncharacterized low-complexity protein
MKSILSAAALLVAIASPALAEESTGTQSQPAPAVVEIVPAATATEPALSEAQPAAVEGETQSKAAMGGHGCGSKKTVYLTN